MWTSLNTLMSERKSPFEFHLMLPLHLVSTLGLFWCSDNPLLILREDVLEWLEANDICYSISYDETDLEDECDHFISFQSHYDSFAFKMRWF
jgi:hypothetical protein